MFDLVIASKEKHQRFIQRVLASREVWGLKNSDGWACTNSTVEAHKGRQVMPFWSDQAYAKQCAKEEWAHYEPALIPFKLFLERWLVGMANDKCLVGTNWNAQLCGHEIEALELKSELEHFEV